MAGSVRRVPLRRAPLGRRASCRPAGPGARHRQPRRLVPAHLPLPGRAGVRGAFPGAARFGLEPGRPRRRCAIRAVAGGRRGVPGTTRRRRAPRAAGHQLGRQAGGGAGSPASRAGRRHRPDLSGPVRAAVSRSAEVRRPGRSASVRPGAQTRPDPLAGSGLVHRSPGVAGVPAHRPAHAAPSHGAVRPGRPAADAVRPRKSGLDPHADPADARRPGSDRRQPRHGSLLPAAFGRPQATPALPGVGTHAGVRTGGPPVLPGPGRLAAHLSR